MNAPLDLFPGHWNRSRDGRDWLAIYREAELAAETAAEAVRAACETFKADRSADNAATYRAADKAFDAARLDYQRTSYQLVTGVRAIAGIARHFELLGATGRML